MILYLKLFFTFFKIGLFTFGGGYAMISMIREAVLGNSWLTEVQFLDFIAVSESTPGPFAINMATFVGSSQGGVLGAVCTTLGVVLPSFLVILLIVSILRGLLRYKGVQAFLTGVRPCVVGLIVATGLSVSLQTFLSLSTVADTVGVNWRGIVIFALVALAGWGYRKWRKKNVSPILLILLSAVCGIVLFGFVC